MSDYEKESEGNIQVAFDWEQLDADPGIRTALLEEVEARLEAVNETVVKHTAEIIDARNKWDTTFGMLRGWVVAWGASINLIALQPNFESGLPLLALVAAVCCSLMGLGLVLVDAFVDRTRHLEHARKSSEYILTIADEKSMLRNDAMQLKHWEAFREEAKKHTPTLRNITLPPPVPTKARLRDKFFIIGCSLLVVATLCLAAARVASSSQSTNVATSTPTTSPPPSPHASP
ncbi:MAG: hypothetical protein AAGI37_12575 [Planctomycetota bacterium]